MAFPNVPPGLAFRPRKGGAGRAVGGGVGRRGKVERDAPGVEGELAAISREAVAVVVAALVEAQGAEALFAVVRKDVSEGAVDVGRNFFMHAQGAQRATVSVEGIGRGEGDERSFMSRASEAADAPSDALFGGPGRGRVGRQVESAGDGVQQARGELPIRGEGKLLLDAPDGGVHDSGVCNSRWERRESMARRISTVWAEVAD